MRFSIIFIFIFFAPLYAISQVGIGTTTPNAQLEIKSTNQATPSNTDGILIPKADEFPAIPPTVSQDGMMIYVTGNGTPSKGYYYWDNATTSWVVFSSSVGKINDLSDGKSDNDGSNDGSSVFLGVNAGLIDDSTDNKNVGVGFETLNKNITGTSNSAFGYQTLFNNTASSITAFGFQALYTNSTGTNNTAIGSQALYTNSTGTNNTATGNAALNLNSTGKENTANGVGTLFGNTTGERNTAIGAYSINVNNDGMRNTAIGYRSMEKNTAGNENVASGVWALRLNVSGSNNTANGFNSLRSIITGSNNTAIGTSAGYSNIGSNNVFLGNRSGYNEIGSDKLYIENSNANANNALIYGEFDNNILRVNGELQLGNTVATRYSMPTADGTTNQLMQTDGSGNVSWSTLNNLDVMTINDLFVAPKLIAAPAAPTAGQIYYDTGLNILRCYNGTIWNNLW